MSRLVTLKAAWTIAQGGPAGLQASSPARAHIGEATFRVVDRQLLGGLGVSRDGSVARFAQELRPFRVYDGPIEAHRWSLGGRFVGKARTT
jgi:acyl-CoA dehydrogenase